MFTKQFWLDAFERAARTFAQTVLAVYFVGDVALSAFNIEWDELAGIGLGGALFSVLTSIASVNVGEKGSASVLSSPED